MRSLGIYFPVIFLLFFKAYNQVYNMKKAVLEGNILPKAKQRLLFEGFPSAEIHYITRDVVPVEVGVITLPDQTQVPGGRVRAGEFGVTLQMARNEDRNRFIEWFEMCIDDGRERGIDATYKRNGTIIYLRLFRGSAGNFNSGSDLPPVRARLFGCWPSKYELPDYDMNADNGDGDCMLKLTLKYDSAFVEKSR